MGHATRNAAAQKPTKKSFIKSGFACVEISRFRCNSISFAGCEATECDGAKGRGNGSCKIDLKRLLARRCPTGDLRNGHCYLSSGLMNLKVQPATKAPSNSATM